MAQQLRIIVMSGIEDGTALDFDVARDGVTLDRKWTLTIGRKDDNDLVLRHDTFVSRQHAKIHLLPDESWLEDLNSTNGSFIENDNDFFNDRQISGLVRIKANQLFRIGRSWLRFEIMS
jgi:pSer/pThr/pTyr-binding forkhead associated (FHA) protein